MESKKLIRFDWAMKKLLRNKANFDVLEGFLSELLSEDVTIKRILESEGNKDDADDKHNRVDILVENTKGELIIIEVQNSKEYDYFHRILYGTSKAITEYIDEGEAYAKIKKVISVTIAYFDLGQGKDYVYHGITQFKGIHKGDTLNLAERQIEIYNVEKVHNIYPEYWIIKVGKFNNIIQDKLDEWIYFLKNGEVQETFSAKGLPEAKKKLDEINLSEEEKVAYQGYLNRLRDIASEQHTKMEDAKKLLEEFDKGVEKGKKEAIIGMHKIGIATDKIAEALNISEEKVVAMIREIGNE
ncbi:MAG: Rpn family recombination-promoting nuclease/putative transposase [Bacteroidota bacterium]